MDFRIRKSADACAACERAFELGDEMYSMLVFDEQQPRRDDYCPGCFERAPREGDSVFAFWRTHKSTEGRARRQVDFGTLRQLFFRMVRQPGGDYRKLTYLLALLLLRKRSIRLQEFTTENGGDYLVVTARQHPEPIRVEAPELLPADFIELRERLQSLLDFDVETDLEQPIAASGDDAEASAAAES